MWASKAAAPEEADVGAADGDVVEAAGPVQAGRQREGEWRGRRLHSNAVPQLSVVVVVVVSCSNVKCFQTRHDGSKAS